MVGPEFNLPKSQLDKSTNPNSHAAEFALQSAFVLVEPIAQRQPNSLLEEGVSTTIHTRQLKLPETPPIITQELPEVSIGPNINSETEILQRRRNERVRGDMGIG